MIRANFKTLLTDPFRVFFPLGVLYGCIGVGHWLFYHVGVVEVPSKSFHANIQIFGFLMCFGMGFLLTALPKWMGSRNLSTVELVCFLGLTILLSFLVSVGQEILANAAILTLLVCLFLFVMKRFRFRAQNPPPSVAYVPMGLLSAAIGAVISLELSVRGMDPVWAEISRELMYQGLFLCFVLGIAGFLAPRLMGVAHMLKVENNPGPQSSDLRGYILPMIKGSVLIATFFFEESPYEFLAEIVRAALVTFVLFRNTLMWKLPRDRQVYILALWSSLWLVVIGVWSLAFFPKYHMALMHILFIGGFSLMIYAIATRVTLAHCGFGNLLTKKSPLLLTAFVSIFVAVLSRVGADFSPESYFMHLSLASIFWIMGSLLWLFIMLPKMFYAPPPGQGGC